MTTGFLFDSAQTGEAALKALKLRVLGCDACGLHTSRTQAVFGHGNSNSPWVSFVGEAPGANEDEQGVPFVGRAGDLLNKMIAAMGFKREEVYVCNAVNCRPPENRKPEPGEMQACRPHLLGQLKIVKPKYIVTLGATATNTILKTDKPLKNLRGNWHEWEGVKVRATFHPAYLLRDKSKKTEAWEDLKAVLAWINRDRGIVTPAPELPSL